MANLRAIVKGVDAISEMAVQKSVGTAAQEAGIRFADEVIQELAASPSPLAVVLFGIQGSGKSTFASKLEQHGFSWLSADRYSLHPMIGPSRTSVKMEAQILEAMANRQSVVIDSVLTHEGHAKMASELLKRSGHQDYFDYWDGKLLKKSAHVYPYEDIRFLHMDTPLKTCLRRVRERDGSSNTRYMFDLHKDLRNSDISQFGAQVYRVRP